MTANRNRRTETVVYSVIWLIVIGLYLLDVMRARAQLSEPLLDWRVMASAAGTLLPFFILFIINNNLLIPRLLLRNRLLPYFLAAAAVIVLLWAYQSLHFLHEMELRPRGVRPFPHPHVRPLLPMPLFLDFTYALLVVGCNLAVALMFQRFDDKLERESLMKSNAENQLAYLKAQINPHFYMNMLNNIHGMIEIDPERAQGMLIDMSQLMRYTLYDSSRPLIPLSEEVSFLENYIRLMRQRYPESRVKITSSFPSENVMRGISLPPLLSLVFVENAFKHGISYRETSFVAVSVETDGNELRFSCVNSCHPCMRDDSPAHSGIGLRNVRQRLQLLYGDEFSLVINDSEKNYTVTLTIPVHGTENIDNR